MNQLQQIAFCGGGSGGHLFPAIAIAQELLDANPDIRFLFVTSDRAIDHQIIAASGLPPESFEQMILPLRSSAGRVSFALKTVRAAFQCRRRFQQVPPNIVVGLGGFASIAGVVAGWGNRVPIVLLEQNTIPGRANQWLRRLAVRTFTGWPLESKWQDRWQTEVVEVGVPLRRSFRGDEVGTQSQSDTSSEASCLLVLGGSQGAVRLNSIVLDALTNGDSHGAGRPLQVVHQTGSGDVDRVQQAYARAGIPADVCAFIDDMPRRLASATLVISRSGAVALAEIAASGKASVLFPLPGSADQHQLRNAECLESSGAAVVIAETDSNASLLLSQQLDRLLTCKNQLCGAGADSEDMPKVSSDAARTTVTAGVPRVAMETAARGMAPENAAAVIAESLLCLTAASAGSSE
jgi:UDP-N-acetylglucosamine--N-acetylmuramyl-(pentapeptide) pyrophosphoryl-undecaprenol N-acetylglucosamine transferase